VAGRLTFNSGRVCRRGVRNALRRLPCLGWLTKLNQARGVPTPGAVASLGLGTPRGDVFYLNGVAVRYRCRAYVGRTRSPVPEIPPSSVSSPSARPCG